MWRVAGSPTAVFDGKSWRTYAAPFTGREEHQFKSFIAAFPGADGAMIFEDDQYQFHLFDAEGWAKADSAPALARNYPERVRRALAYPPGIMAITFITTWQRTETDISGGRVGTIAGAPSTASAPLRENPRAWGSGRTEVEPWWCYFRWTKGESWLGAQMARRRLSRSGTAAHASSRHNRDLSRNWP
jgi:hypothetical protein